MASSTLPKQIDPIRFTEKGVTLEGKLPLQTMPRLLELVAEKSGEVAVALQFDKTDQGLRYIQGRVSTQLLVTCQRCLGLMTQDIDAQVKLSPVFNEAAAERLPKDYEPLMVTEEPMLLSEMVEDELLLNMPIVTRHEDEHCQVRH